MRSPRAWFGSALVAVVFLVLLPDPRPLASTSTVGFAELLDPA